MANQVVTELVIDADTSGADRFCDAMDHAGNQAGSAQASVAQMTLAVAGVGIAVVGAIAGLRAFVDYVGQQTQQLVDLSDRAERAGMAVGELQQALFAARAAGVSDKDFFAGINKITSDLTQASQQATEFGKLFEANGLKIKDQNGHLISTRQALSDIMGLMQEASPAVQQRIAQIAGVSASWIPFLKQGVEQFEIMKQRAADLGIVIDNDTIAKAQEFNAQWKEAVATWDLQFKASMASILPLLTQLATLASSIISGIGSVSGSVGRWLTPVEGQSRAQLSDTINDIYRLREQVEALGGSIDKGSVKGFRAANLANMLGLPEGATLDQVDQLLERVQKQQDGTPERIRVTPNAGTTVLPNMGGKDEIERASDAIERHIAKLKADAEAAGQGTGELERLRVEAQLYAAAERAGITDTERFAKQFGDLAERAGAAAQALEKAKIGADIRFGSKTAFLSQEDVQIASQLKGLYPDVAAALNSAEAAQMRFNTTARQLSTSIENSLTSGLVDIVTHAKSASEAFRSMGASIVKALDEAIIKMLIVQPLMRSLGGITGGSSLLPGVAGSSFFGPVAPSANGNVFSSGSIVPFAQGGVVDSPTIAPMALFGERGPEAIIPLRRGADGNLGVAGGSGGGATNISYQIDATGADSGTVEKIRAVLAEHAKAIAGQAKAMKSAGAYQRTGVY